MNSPYLSFTITGEPFHLLSPSHLVTLLISGCLVTLLYIYRHKLKESSVNFTARITLALLLLLSEVFFQLWHVWTNSWSVVYTLPLQLCSVTLLLSAFMLLTKSNRIYEITFFAGIGGALQAMLTPELFYPFPHVRFIHFFAAHLGIILACLYMTWVEDYRPTIRSVWKTMGFLNVLLLIALPINHWTGGNYLFVSRKPDNPSLIDYLGPYPWYLLSLEAVALIVFFLLYLPFSKRQSTVSHSIPLKKDSLP